MSRVSERSLASERSSRELQTLADKLFHGELGNSAYSVDEVSGKGLREQASFVLSNLEGSVSQKKSALQEAIEQAQRDEEAKELAIQKERDEDIKLQETLTREMEEKAREPGSPNGKVKRIAPKEAADRAMAQVRLLVSFMNLDEIEPDLGKLKRRPLPPMDVEDELRKRLRPLDLKPSEYFSSNLEQIDSLIDGFIDEKSVASSAALDEEEKRILEESSKMTAARMTLMEKCACSRRLDETVREALKQGKLQGRAESTVAFAKMTTGAVGMIKAMEANLEDRDKQIRELTSSNQLMVQKVEELHSYLNTLQEKMSTAGQSSVSAEESAFMKEKHFLEKEMRLLNAMKHSYKAKRPKTQKEPSVDDLIKKEFKSDVSMKEEEKKADAKWVQKVMRRTEKIKRLQQLNLKLEIQSMSCHDILPIPSADAFAQTMPQEDIIGTPQWEKKYAKLKRATDKITMASVMSKTESGMHNVSSDFAIAQLLQQSGWRVVEEETTKTSPLRSSPLRPPTSPPSQEQPEKPAVPEQKDPEEEKLEEDEEEAEDYSVSLAVEHLMGNAKDLITSVDMVRVQAINEMTPSLNPMQATGVLNTVFAFQAQLEQSIRDSNELFTKSLVGLKTMVTKRMEKCTKEGITSGRLELQEQLDAAQEAIQTLKDELAQEKENNAVLNEAVPTLTIENSFIGTPVDVPLSGRSHLSTATPSKKSLKSLSKKGSGKDITLTPSSPPLDYLRELESNVGSFIKWISSRFQTEIPEPVDLGGNESRATTCLRKLSLATVILDDLIPKHAGPLIQSKEIQCERHREEIDRRNALAQTTEMWPDLDMTKVIPKSALESLCVDANALLDALSKTILAVRSACQVVLNETTLSEVIQVELKHITDPSDIATELHRMFDWCKSVSRTMEQFEREVDVPRRRKMDEYTKREKWLTYHPPVSKWVQTVEIEDAVLIEEGRISPRHLSKKEIDASTPKHTATDSEFDKDHDGSSDTPGDRPLTTVTDRGGIATPDQPQQSGAEDVLCGDDEQVEALELEDDEEDVIEDGSVRSNVDDQVDGRSRVSLADHSTSLPPSRAVSPAASPQRRGHRGSSSNVATPAADSKKDSNGPSPRKASQASSPSKKNSRAASRVTSATSSTPQHRTTTSRKLSSSGAQKEEEEEDGKLFKTCQQVLKHLMEMLHKVGGKDQRRPDFHALSPPSSGKGANSVSLASIMDTTLSTVELLAASIRVEHSPSSVVPQKAKGDKRTKLSLKADELTSASENASPQSKHHVTTSPSKKASTSSATTAHPEVVTKDLDDAVKGILEKVVKLLDTTTAQSFRNDDVDTRTIAGVTDVLNRISKLSIWEPRAVVGTVKGGGMSKRVSPARTPPTATARTSSSSTPSKKKRVHSVAQHDKPLTDEEVDDVPSLAASIHNTITQSETQTSVEMDSLLTEKIEELEEEVRKMKGLLTAAEEATGKLILLQKETEYEKSDLFLRCAEMTDRISKLEDECNELTHELTLSSSSLDNDSKKSGVTEQQPRTVHVRSTQTEELDWADAIISSSSRRRDSLTASRTVSTPVQQHPSTPLKPIVALVEGVNTPTAATRKKVVLNPIVSTPTNTVGNTTPPVNRDTPTTMLSPSNVSQYHHNDKEEEEEVPPISIGEMVNKMSTSERNSIAFELTGPRVSSLHREIIRLVENFRHRFQLQGTRKDTNPQDHELPSSLSDKNMKKSSIIPNLGALVDGDISLIQTANRFLEEERDSASAKVHATFMKIKAGLNYGKVAKEHGTLQLQVKATSLPGQSGYREMEAKKARLNFLAMQQENLQRQMMELEAKRQSIREKQLQAKANFKFPNRKVLVLHKVDFLSAADLFQSKQQSASTTSVMHQHPQHHQHVFRQRNNGYSPSHERDEFMSTFMHQVEGWLMKKEESSNTSDHQSPAAGTSAWKHKGPKGFPVQSSLKSNATTTTLRPIQKRPTAMTPPPLSHSGTSLTSAQQMEHMVLSPGVGTGPLTPPPLRGKMTDFSKEASRTKSSESVSALPSSVIPPKQVKKPHPKHNLGGGGGGGNALLATTQGVPSVRFLLKQHADKKRMKSKAKDEAGGNDAPQSRSSGVGFVDDDELISLATGIRIV